MQNTANAVARRRVHFNYQYQKRITWKAPAPWQSNAGKCTAIRMNPDQTFDVSVEKKGQASWRPIGSVLSEHEVIGWLRRCNEL